MSSTDRWRRWKARQDAGEIMLYLPVDNALVELMLDAGKIDERASRNKRQLAATIRRLCVEACSNALDTPTRR